MAHAFEPVLRQSLSDDVAQRITQLISTSGFTPGSRLPAISQMARDFAVGAPTLREALKKLETVGVVDIRHGSGVYVGRSPDSLFISNPIFETAPTKKLMADLIEARIPVETQAASLAAKNATDAQLKEMNSLLDRAMRSLDDDSALSEINMSFHRQIALASGNAVLHQILDVLGTLFREEQRLILDIHGKRKGDHSEHVGIYLALAARDAGLATQRMHDHLTRVHEVILQWDPEQHPVH